MSYMDFIVKKKKWDVLKTWNFPDGFTLALCEAHIKFDLNRQAPFFVMFGDGMYLTLPDEIGEKLTGTRGGTEK